MKVRLTFEFDDRDRRAMAIQFKRKRPASRTEVIQFVTERVMTRMTELHADLRRREADPDPHQLKIPTMEEAYA